MDERELERVFETERNRLHRFLLRLTGVAADADDLLQETLLAVWRRRDALQGRGSAEGYLRRTAYRLFINHRKTGERRVRLHRRGAVREGAGGPERAIERADCLQFLRQRVAEAVASLPEKVRAAFVLHRYEGMTVREIAEVTEVPLKTVETRLRRAVELLSMKLRPYRGQLPVGP